MIYFRADIRFVNGIGIHVVVDIGDMHLKKYIYFPKTS